MAIVTLIPEEAKDGIVCLINLARSALITMHSRTRRRYGRLDAPGRNVGARLSPRETHRAEEWVSA